MRVCESVCCVAAVVKDSGILILGVLKYIVCLCSGYDGCCVFCLYCDAWSYKCSCMGSMVVSSCRCCMFVSCVHPVAVLNAAFCMTCSLLMPVEDGRGILQRYGCGLLARPKIDIQSSIVKTSTYFFSCSVWLCPLLRKKYV